MKKSHDPEYIVYSCSRESFFKRVIRSSFKPIILASLSIIAFLGIAYRDAGGEFALIAGVCFILYVFVSTWIQNIIHLESIVFDTKNEIVRLEIHKYNELCKKTEYPIRNIHIELKRVMFIYSSYYLVVYDFENKTRIVKQPLVGGWKLDQFQEIITTMKDMPGYRSIYNQYGG